MQDINSYKRFKLYINEADGTLEWFPEGWENHPVFGPSWLLAPQTKITNLYPDPLGAVGAVPPWGIIGPMVATPAWPAMDGFNSAMHYEFTGSSGSNGILTMPGTALTGGNTYTLMFTILTNYDTTFRVEYRLAANTAGGIEVVPSTPLKAGTSKRVRVTAVFPVGTTTSLSGAVILLPLPVPPVPIEGEPAVAATVDVSGVMWAPGTYTGPFVETVYIPRTVSRYPADV